MLVMTPLKPAVKSKVPFPDIFCKISGWNITRNMAAKTVDKNKVMIVGNLNAISTPVITGTISNQGVIWNVSFNVFEKAAI